VFAGALAAAAMLATAGCSTPGRPSPDSQVVPPNRIADFNILYGTNCAGCHGQDGKNGAAVPIGDPVYLAIADDAAIRRVVANGVPGTAMSAFAQSAGGMLTSAQVDALVSGIRAHWAKPDVLRGQDPPPYAAEHGDPSRGANVFTVYCASCHGADGRGGPRASSIVDASYLSLVSDQHLRTTVIVGLPDLGAPDWRADVPGKPMSHQDVSDVVAWLAAARPQFTNEAHAGAKTQAGGIQ
jgi:cytochrome c oxidase cbb3-type subunit 3